MTKKLSLIACGLILSTSSVFAESTLEEAFKAGKASGDISVYSDSKDNSTGVNAGFTAGTIGVTYETGTFYNLNAKASFRAGHKFDETENNDYKGSFTQNSVMNEALIKYSRDSFSLSVGRQAVDYEWITKYAEGAIAEITAIPNTTLTLGFADRRAKADVDEITAFVDVNKDGIYFIDAKIGGVEGLEIKPYYYSMPKLADVYGIRAAYSNGMFGIVGQYAATNEDVTATKDGDIAHIELSATASDITLTAGYFTTDKDGGVGSMTVYGDSLSPMDEGSKVFNTDAETFYGSIGTTISGLSLTALYGSTEYLNGSAKEKEKELNLTASMEVVKNTNVSFRYIDVNENSSSTDWDKIEATFTYTF